MTITEEDLQQISRWFGDMMIEALDRHSLAAREAALAQTRKQRVTVQSQVGHSVFNFETVIDEGTSADELYRLLEPYRSSIDRMIARSDMQNLYLRMRANCAELELDVVQLINTRRGFDMKNRSASENRRLEVGITPEQQKELNSQRSKINEIFAKIESEKVEAEEHRQVMEGADPLAFQRAEIDRRLDALRGQRVPPEAA